MVILITGKAGAGKTNYAVELYNELASEGKKPVLIDGDTWRSLHGNDDFSELGRINNLESAAKYAAEKESEGRIVILAFVAPRKQWRNKMRTHWKESRLIYIPGGTLWEGTEYEMPDEDEFTRTYIN